MTHSTVRGIAILFAAVVFLQSFVFAQPESRPPQPMGGQMPPGDPVKEMKRILKLTDEQTVQIEKIFESQRDEMDSIRDASEAERDALRERMDANRKKTDDKINSILTEKQKQKFEEMKKKQQRRPDRMPDSERMPRPDHENGIR